MHRAPPLMPLVLTLMGFFLTLSNSFKQFQNFFVFYDRVSGVAKLIYGEI